MKNNSREKQVKEDIKNMFAKKPNMPLKTCND